VFNPIFATNAVDQSLHNWVISHRVAWLNDPMRYITDLADRHVAMPLLLVMIIGLLARKRIPEAAFLAVVVFGAQFLSRTLKVVIGRSRPEEVHRLVRAGGPAFPSGHSFQAVATFGAVAFLAWHLGWVKSKILVVGVPALMAFCVGVSRVYLGVHWPTDVLGGWIIGGLWLSLCCFGFIGYTQRFVLLRNATFGYQKRRVVT